MTDFVRILQQYATAKGWIYSYGRKSNLNLLAATTDLENQKIYLLHEASPRKPQKNATGTGIQSILFTGYFFLMVKSEQDMPYFNEKHNDEAQSKYSLYIEPLLQEYLGMMKSFMCDDMDVKVFEAIDTVNLFDENRDGILVTYQVEIKQ